jgi:hypothetical protein
LISSQTHLKSLGLSAYGGNWKDVVPVFKKHRNTITRLHVKSIYYVGLSFVASFTNLQELVLSTYYYDELQHITFPGLQIFRILHPVYSSNPQILVNFLQNNGKTLTDLGIDDYIGRSLNPSIIQHCSNLKNLVIIVKKDELDTLKDIFNGCQYLESILIWCGNGHLDEEEMLDVVAKDSPKNLHILKILQFNKSILPPKALESFLSNWGKRIPQKSLTLIVIGDKDINEERIMIIEKYKKLGIIKEFKIEMYGTESYLFYL